MENIHQVRIKASNSDSNRLTINEIQALFLFNRLFHDNENNDPTHMAMKDGT
jgi:hypothetical protein